MFCCHQCQQQWISDKRQPGTKECCDACDAYLHCCLNCRFHSPSAHNQCYIPNTEWVGDRRKLNFCDEFEFKTNQQNDPNQKKQDEARNTLSNIFNQNDDPNEKPPTLDDLFG